MDIIQICKPNKFQIIVEINAWPYSVFAKYFFKNYIINKISIFFQTPEKKNV